ncbi:MAG: DNA-3-methyladenine glycosylase 2 family protein [Gemmatimonadaceae bacterium]|nr:DNA-3-methyladenine glycosylase 2 family protein [Gemmatimonadaceae bacterium]
MPLPPGFDYAWAVRFLAARVVPSIESVAPMTYRRVVWIDATDVGAAVRAPVSLVFRVVRGRGGGARLAMRMVPSLPAPVARRVAIRMFDLDADLAAFHSMARRDAVLRPVIAATGRGLRLPQLLDPFEALVRAVLGQQVSVQAASTMTDRVVRALGVPAPSDADEDDDATPRLAFPRPAAIAEAGIGALRALGITAAKARALCGIARAIEDGQLDLAALRRRPPEEVHEALLALPGIGPWTASYVRMRALGDRDAFPAEDLGVVKAMAARGVARAEIAAVAERWRPWRAYATLHLWHSLAAPHPRATSAARRRTPGAIRHGAR